MNNFFKKYGVYINFDRAMFFIIEPSSRALALHARIIIVKHEWKIVKMKNECTKVSEVEFFDTKISNLSFNLNLKTSCALPPYYSLELDPISSTSHVKIIQIVF